MEMACTKEKEKEGVRKVGENQGEQDDPEAKSSWRAKFTQK